MPWQVADVEGHFKGLSDNQKGAWVRVANSALSRYDEAEAIKQANASAKRMQEGDYILFEGRLQKMDMNLLERLMSTAAPGKKTAQEKPYYITMMTRGCRYACTYCCNRTLLRLYGGRAFVRRRSVENVIEELSWVRENLPFVQLLVLSDDSFFDTDELQIRAFCEAYRAKIGLPFFSLGTPFGIDDSKLEMMVDAEVWPLPTYAEMLFLR